MDSGSLRAAARSGMTPVVIPAYAGIQFDVTGFRIRVGRADVRNDERLLGFEARGLDDREPLVDLGLVVRVERLGRELLARRNLLPELREPRAHGRIVQRFDDRRVQ